MAETVLGQYHIKVPTGTTNERPQSPTNGMMRYNTTTNKLEYYNASSTSWVVIEKD